MVAKSVPTKFLAGLRQHSFIFTLLKIWILIAAFHVTYLSFLSAGFWLIRGKLPLQIGLYLDTGYDLFWTKDGYAMMTRTVSLWLSAIPFAWVLKTVVERSAHCFEFIACVFAFHWTMAFFFAKIPADLNWYMAYGLHASLTCVVAEKLCDRDQKRKTKH